MTEDRKNQILKRMSGSALLFTTALGLYVLPSIHSVTATCLTYFLTVDLCLLALGACAVLVLDAIAAFYTTAEHDPELASEIKSRSLTDKLSTVPVIVAFKAIRFCMLADLRTLWGFRAFNIAATIGILFAATQVMAQTYPILHIFVILAAIVLIIYFSVGFGLYITQIQNKAMFENTRTTTLRAVAEQLRLLALAIQFAAGNRSPDLCTALLGHPIPTSQEVGEILTLAPNFEKRQAKLNELYHELEQLAA